jgi:hypothetical protein
MPVAPSLGTFDLLRKSEQRRDHNPLRFEFGCETTLRLFAVMRNGLVRSAPPAFGDAQGRRSFLFTERLFKISTIH